VAKLSIPDEVLNKARIHGAQAWIDGLPDLIASLERDWSIRVGRSFRGGTEAYVAEAELADGTQAVLKLLVPRADNDPESEIAAYEIAGGEGLARLYRHDASRCALLLERLGRPLASAGLSLEQRHDVFCGLLKQMWRPVRGARFMTGAEKGRWLVRFIQEKWELLGRPLPERVVAHALACAERRVAAHDDSRAMLVHGDLHDLNVLEAADGTWKAIDPDGLAAEPEYDLGILMREDSTALEGDGHARARALAARTGLDADAIWEWGVVERVSSGLLCTQLGLEPIGREMLAAAVRVSYANPA
jgi:streptomycin 6-kinase